MYGSKMGSLEVKTNTTSLFLRTGDQQNQWHYAVVPVEAEDDLLVKTLSVYSLVTSNTKKKYIASNDLQLSKVWHLL